MRGRIVITFEDGTVMSGTVQTSAPAGVTQPSQDFQQSVATNPIRTSTIDFSLPVRPFMNDYSDGLSGSKKLTLLVAHFAKGEVDVAVDRAEVIETWNKMTGLLGGKFNGAHEARAKDSGYIYVPSVGRLALLKKWQQVLQ